MKKSIFLFFAAILCATSAWGNTTFQAGEILFYDFSAITGGANWSWNNGGGLAYDANAQNSVKAIIFTAKETWNPNKVIAKTNKGGWAEIKFKDRTAGTNCIKIGADGKSYTWTTHSIEEDVLSGKYIMVYGGELNSWSPSEYWFLTEANDERKAAVAKTKLSITISSEAYKMGPVLLPAGSTSYIQGHWNSGMKCSVEAGSAYVVRSSTSKSNYTQKGKSGSDYLYQVKQNATAPTKTLSPTCPTKILQGEKLSFSHGAAGVSVVGKTNTVKYYLQNGTTYTEKTLTDGTIDVSDLPAGNYSIITLLYDGYIYVKASTSNFTIESAYDVTFANDGNGTTNQTGTIKVGSSTGIVIDATPSTDYEFKAWESSNGGSFATTAADASNTFYPTANTTLTATFRSTAVNALLVVAGENITSVTGSVEPVTLGSICPISATFPTGYKFTTWTAEPAANATFADAASATTDVTVLNGSVTVTASAEEVLSTLTTANEYNEGTPTIAAPTASAVKIGVTTTATVTAAAGTGYTFAGWKLDNCVRTDAGADNATTITVKSNGDGADAKVTAKYEQNVVYFVNTKGWSTVKVYAWNDGGASNAAWSGVALTDANIVKQIGGCDVYKYVPGADYAKVIFNNGSEQTDDLAWQNGKYYVYNSENTKDVSDWYDESEVEGVLPDPVELKYTVEVPAGTHECYIAGDMNGWALTKMDPVDATHFTLTIQWATNAHKYKYAAGPTWDYEEQKADGSNVSDRTYNANDKVAKWKNVYNPSATVYDYYIVGTMNGWSEINENYGMSKVGETTTYSKELNLAAGTYEFKVKKNGGDWFGEYEGDYKEVSYKDGNIQIVLTAATNVTIKFDSSSKKISFDGLTPNIITYTVVGHKDILGEAWNTESAVNIMEKDGDNYILVKTGCKLDATDYEYKVVKNGQYGDGEYPTSGNNKLTIAESGIYTVTFTYKVGTSLTAKTQKTGDYTPEKATYTIAGSPALCGSEWKADDAANDMTDNGDGTFMWTKSVELAKNVEFKIVKNRSFDVASYPSDNKVIDIKDGENYKTGVYTIVITFTEATKEIQVIATRTGDLPKKTIVYTVTVPAGTKQCYIVGDMNSWTAQAMTPAGANKFSISIDNVTVATEYKYSSKDGDDTWAYVEKKNGNGEVDNRTYNANDVVERWNRIDIADGENAAIIGSHAGKGEVEVYVDRELKAGKLYTISLPFAVADADGLFGSGTVVYEYAELKYEDDEYALYFDNTKNTMEAGKPYLVQPGSDRNGFEYKNTDVVFEQKVISKTVNNTTISMESVLSVTAGATTNGKYWLASDNCLYNVSTALKSLRAVFNIQSNKANVRARVAFGENVETGIEDIFTTDAPVKVIKNGQLIIIRDGVKYNVQGQKL